MSWTLLVPLAAAYLVACGGWLGGYRLTRPWWPSPEPLGTEHKWLDLAMVVVAAASILGLGWVWRQGWLLPEPEGWAGDVLWQFNNLLIYCPIVVILAHRDQSIRTIYLWPAGLPVKLAAGLFLGTLAVVTYVLLRGEIVRLPGIALDTVRIDNVRYVVPVFLEGVALAFAYVRLRWALGRWTARIAPGLLLAAAHIPRQLESGLGTPAMVASFMVTVLIAFVVLFTLERSRDVIWIGVVHYLMDVAIGAFD